jgi:4-hydroxy-tetrahydrodipicolinate synthase
LPDLPVAGLKDSSGDAARLLHERDVFAGDLYTGAASLLSTNAAVGGTGGLVAMANVAPELCVAAWGGDAAAQVELARLERTASADFPAGYKRAAAERFGIPVTTRVGH